MTQQLANVAFYGGVAGLSTIAGIYLVLSREDWAHQASKYLVGFAAGALMAVAMGNLLPEAMEKTPQSLPLVLAGFLAFYILEHGFAIHGHHEERDPQYIVGLVGFAGLAFHSLLDGIVIGAGFEVSTALGIVAALGVISHELPEGITIIVILIHAGFDRRRAIVFSWIVALATPVGAVVSYLFLGGISEEVVGGLLAVAAGAFLYVAASDLIPQTHRESGYLNVVAVLAGAIGMLLVGMLLGGG